LSDIAIHVENIAKKYQIAQNRQRYQTFRNTLTNMVSAPFRRVRSVFRGEAAVISQTDFWALHDISFEVKQGETVGIIGRNGAGKSTLLKVLSRITEPTSGFIDVRGRVGALLEVGTGFHPELTGRENVFLNGAILGMQRAEIARKFDEIVDFAGVGQFVDTPVKHYSSGMGLRLGFAVAAYMEPDILIVDEVLAVGDAEFQKKCIGKMNSVASEGRTVLFVSHNMAAVQSLCRYGILLQDGYVRTMGDIEAVIQHYAGQNRQESTSISLVNHPGRQRFEALCMRELRFSLPENPDAIFMTHKPFHFDLDCLIPVNLRTMSLGFLVKDSLGNYLFGANMAQYDQTVALTAEERDGLITIHVKVQQLPLSPGVYALDLFMGTGSYEIDIIRNAAYFEVLWSTDVIACTPPQPVWGPIFVPVVWDYHVTAREENVINP